MNALKTKCFLRAHLPTLVLAFLPSWAAADCAVDPYYGQICMVGYNFCPINTLPADGRQISIAGNDALFSLLGTTYGGDGINTFGLPNLSSRAPVGQGTRPGGFSSVGQGQMWGTETNTLTINTMPSHNHAASSTLLANTGLGNRTVPSPGNNALAGMAVQELTGSGVVVAQRWAAPEGDSAKTTAVAGLSTSLAMTGGNLPIDTAPPSLGMRYCIVTAGVYPPYPN